MGFVLGARSRAQLKGVHPDLVRVVERAILITSQDFTVFQGLRTPEEQKKHVASGTSQTLDSKHLKQRDGYGHAVDLVPWIDGKLQWHWPAVYPIAAAMWRASLELGVRIKWGGPWRMLEDIKNGTPADMKREVDAYVNARLLSKKKAFNDGPHFELVQ